MDIKEVINYLGDNSDKLIEENYSVTMTVTFPNGDTSVMCFGSMVNELIGITHVMMNIKEDFLKSGRSEKEWKMLEQKVRSDAAFSRILRKKMKEMEEME